MEISRVLYHKRDLQPTTEYPNEILPCYTFSGELGDFRRAPIPGKFAGRDEGGRGRVWGGVRREQTRIMAAERKTMLQGCQHRGYLIDRISPRAPQVWEPLLCCSAELFY